MNKYLSFIIALAATLVMPTAFAGMGTPLPPTPQWGACTTQGNCVCDAAHRSPYCQPGSTNTNTNTNNNSNSQGQGQGQSQSATGGNSSADNSGGNSAVTVDTGSRAVNSGNDNSRYTFIPSVVPGTPPSALGVGNLSVIVTACGPLLAKTSEPIEGSYMGLLSTSRVDLGNTDSVQQAMLGGAPARYNETRDQDGTIHQEGSQAVITSGIVGVSGARNLALGGGSSGGSWGQAGGGSSSSMQRIVTSVQIIPCDHGALAPAPPAVVYVPVEAPKPASRRRYLVRTCHPVGIMDCPAK